MSEHDSLIRSDGSVVSTQDLAAIPREALREMAEIMSEPDEPVDD